MQIDSDDFALFGLTRRFALDRGELDERRRALMAEVHPDRFAAGGDAAKRVAMQWTVRLNEAYARLKDPLQRAEQLCGLNGAAVGAEDNSAMPADFLMAQMAWHESLDDARTTEDVESLSREVEAKRRDGLSRLEQALDVAGDFVAAAQQVRALMFIERIAHEVEERLERDKA